MGVSPDLGNYGWLGGLVSVIVTGIGLGLSRLDKRKEAQKAEATEEEKRNADMSARLQKGYVDMYDLLEKRSDKLGVQLEECEERNKKLTTEREQLYFEKRTDAQSLIDLREQIHDLTDENAAFRRVQEARDE